MDHASGTRARTGLALLLAVAMLTVFWAPAATATADPGSGGRTGSAWLPYWGDVDAAYRDALRHASQLHTVSPFWYETSSDTGIKGHAGAGRRDIIDGLHDAASTSCPP